MEWQPLSALKIYNIFFGTFLAFAGEMRRVSRKQKLKNIVFFE